MSKICGIVSDKQPKDYLKPALEQMSVSMKHQPWHQAQLWHDDLIAFGHVSIGAVNQEPQPFFSSDGSKTVIFAGKIFGYEEERKELMNKGYKFRYADNDAEFLLHLYEEYGEKKFSTLNGMFTLAIWDRKKKKFLLVNDRYGMRPMFYYFDQDKKTFFFASELKSISGLRQFKKRVNWDAWNVFLRLGFLINDETFFKDVYVLPAASILQYDFEKIEIKAYWDCDQIKVKSKFDEDKDIDNLVYLFKQSIKRRVLPQKKVAVFLSGGPDSSGIAAELKSQKVDFISYTTRKFYKYDEDQKSAEFIANALGIENKFYDLPEKYLQVYEPIKNNLLDYQCAVHAWLLPLLEKIPNDTRINFDGLGFDFTCDTCIYDSSHLPYRRILETKKFRDFARNWYYSEKGYYFLLWPRNGQSQDFIFLKERLREKFSLDAFIDKVERQLVKSENTTAPYVFFHLMTRARRCVAASVFGLMLNWVESFCPYLDNDFFDYLMSLPIIARINREPMSLRAKILSRAYPQLFAKDSPLVGNNAKNFGRKHPGFYPQTVKNLSKISQDFLFNFRSDCFDPAYLMPRMAKDILESKMYFLLPWRKMNHYNRLHMGIVPQLYMLNKWLVDEGITNINYD